MDWWWPCVFAAATGSTSTICPVYVFLCKVIFMIVSTLEHGMLHHINAGLG